MASRIAVAGKWLGRHSAWLVLIGALCNSTNPMVINFAHTSAGTATFYRCVLAIPFLLALSVVERKKSKVPTTGAHRGWAWLAGALLGVDLLLWTQSISEVGTGLSTVIVNAQVVLVPLLAFLIDRERVTIRYLIAIPFLLFGVALAAGAINGSTVGNDPLWGAIHASLAALFYAGFLYLLRRSGQTSQPVTSLLEVTISAALVSVGVGIFWHGMDFWPGWTAMGWLLLLAVTGQVLGWLFISIGTAGLASHTGAVLLLIQPVAAVVWGALILDELPRTLQLVGCVLILASVEIATLRIAKRARVPQKSGNDAKVD